MIRLQTIAAVLLAITPPSHTDDPPKDVETFNEIARRITPLIERIDYVVVKAKAARLLAECREKANDPDAAKRAYARAIDVWLSERKPAEDENDRTLALVLIAGGQIRVHDRPAALTTIARAHEAAREAITDSERIRCLGLLLTQYRRLEDREATAATANELRRIIKASKEFPEDYRAARLFEVQVKSGDARRAFQSFLAMPIPNDRLPGETANERLMRFRDPIFATMLSACTADDQAVLSEVAKTIRGIRNSQHRDSCLIALTCAYANVRNFDEALRTALSLKTDDDLDSGRARCQVVNTLLNVAMIQVGSDSKLGARHTLDKALSVWETLEKDRERIPELPTPPAIPLRPPRRPEQPDGPVSVPPAPALIFNNDFRKDTLVRFVTLLAKCDERERAMTLSEKLDPQQRVDALEVIANVDQALKHKDEAIGAWKKALEIAKSILAELDGNDAKGSATEQTVRRWDAEAAIVRIYGGLGDVNKAMELIDNAGDAKELRRLQLLEALGRSRNTEAAFRIIDAQQSPELKSKSLLSLFEGLSAK